MPVLRPAASLRRMRFTRLVSAAVLLLCAHVDVLQAQPKRPFTVEDDIQFSRFEDLGGLEGPVLFSPDGEYFAVQTERGRLDIDRPESRVHIYRTAEVRKWIGGDSGPVKPVLTIAESAYRHGPNLRQLRWTRDSSGVAYVARAADGEDRLWFAAPGDRTRTQLSTSGHSVRTFDVLDRRRFAYTVAATSDEMTAEKNSAAQTLTVAGDVNLAPLFPPAVGYKSPLSVTLSELWYAVDGVARRVVQASTGLPVRLQAITPVSPALALAPDARQIVTSLVTEDVPATWAQRYAAPVQGSYTLPVGRQETQSPSIVGYPVRRYVRISLDDGAVQTLLDAPIADSLGWWHVEAADWSANGQWIALANVFMSHAEDSHDAAFTARRPCVAVVSVQTKAASCVERLGSPNQGHGGPAGYDMIVGVRFGSGDQLSLQFENTLTWKAGTRTYVPRSWHLATRTARAPLNVSIRESLSEPPLLVARQGSAGEYKTLWDPNPGLKDVDLGEVREYRWTDAAGREWRGGIYLPSAYTAGEKLPLVIQNHGFIAGRFIPSGLYSSVNAARVLTAAGIAVLQVQDCDATGTAEGSCQTAGYESAIAGLAREGIVDADRVGIMGFSRTCYYVLSALSSGRIPFKAAVISNGVNGGYLQALLDRRYAEDGERLNGAPPYGDGLRTWLQRSPTFNLSRVETPLRIEASEGLVSLVFMWEPYAVLSYLKKPVELVYFRETGTHPLTNPGQRLQSQGGAVDWFRYWLQGYEDPAPANRDRNARWRELRNRADRQ